MSQSDPSPPDNDTPPSGAPVVQLAKTFANGAYKPAPSLGSEPPPGTIEHDSWAGRAITAIDTRLRRVEWWIYVAVLVGAAQLAATLYGQYRATPPAPAPAQQAPAPAPAPAPRSP